MKHIKLFENLLLDKILDKISDTGMNSLTKLEKEYLDKISSKKDKDFESEYYDRNVSLTDEPEPEPGTEYKEETFTDSDTIELEEVDEEMLEHFWSDLPDEHFRKFMFEYNIPNAAGGTRWSLLDGQIKTFFKTFLFDNGFI